MNKRVIGILPLIFLIVAIGGMALLAVCYADTLGTTASIWPCIGIALLLGVAVISLCMFSNEQRDGHLWRVLKPLDGLSDRRVVCHCFETNNTGDEQYSCLVYLSFDGKRIVRRFGGDQNEALQQQAAGIITGFCEEKDAAARIDDGVFLLSLLCKDGLQAQQRVTDLTGQLNELERDLLGSDVAPFRSGLYLPVREKASFCNAYDNAKLGYRYAVDNKVDTFICTKELQIKEESRKHLREKLSRAIDDGQFEVYLQFIRNTKEDRFTQAEVLSRWNNPVEGLLMPAYYIHDMNAIGVIEKFDLSMLDKTCALLEQWQGGEFGELILSCNVTRTSISSARFLKKAREILKKHSFDHGHLILEIPEDALEDNEKTTLDNIRAFREEGLHIAVDDFSVGHSSLDGRDDIPIDQIKLDRDILQTATTKKAAAPLRDTVKQANEKGIETVCEGVETKKQRDIVVDSGCDYVQGYFYSYVFPVEEGQAHYRNSLQAPDAEPK